MDTKEQRRLVQSAKRQYDRKDPQQALHRRCIECVYDPIMPGSAIDQVRECGGCDCPLYRHRRGGSVDGFIVTEPNRKDSGNIKTLDRYIHDFEMHGTVVGSIQAYCTDCNYDASEPGTRRKQIEECKSTGCDLWSVRMAS